MASRKTGIMDRAVTDTPIAILDFETTGLNAGIDRVLEVSVVRIDPG
jgi:DNA polymerase-3 subunit epsilon